MAVMDEARPDRATDWAAIALFWIVAAAWSFAAARWFAVPDAAVGVRIDGSIAVGLGPVAGAVAASLFRKRPVWRTGLLGPKPLLTMIALLAPVITLGIAGHPRPLVGPQVDGVTFAATVLIYCIAEELGWRGWLNDALGGETRVRSALITWVLWFGWHWSFLAKELSSDWRFGVGFAVMTLVASFGLQSAVARTKAVGIAAAFHAAAKATGPIGQVVAMVAIIGAATWAAGRGRVPKDHKPAIA